MDRIKYIPVIFTLLSICGCTIGSHKGINSSVDRKEELSKPHHCKYKIRSIHSGISTRTKYIYSSSVKLTDDVERYIIQSDKQINGLIKEENGSIEVLTNIGYLTWQDIKYAVWNVVVVWGFENARRENHYLYFFGENRCLKMRYYNDNVEIRRNALYFDREPIKTKNIIEAIKNKKEVIVQYDRLYFEEIGGG